MNKDIPLKTSLEVARMRRASEIVVSIFDKCMASVKAGVSPFEINELCGTLIRKYRSYDIQPAYPDFPAWMTISVNNVAVHGIPGREPMEEGDVVTLDLSLAVDGWFSDLAETLVVGTQESAGNPAIDAARTVFLAGIASLRIGNNLSDVGTAAQQAADKIGCTIISECTGHGIGRNPHEEPTILHTTGGRNIPIVSGMVLCIEPVVTFGSGEIVLMEDGWGYKTKDGSITAQFEHTIAVFSDRTEILTKRKESVV
jgi:methionyl aminopeptidase